MRDDGSKVSQSMYGFRENAEVREVEHAGTQVCDQVTRRDRGKRPMVDIYRLRCSRRHLASIERGIGLHDDRPRMRVDGGFAREVTGIEFFERGVDVFEVEPNLRRDSVVGVDLDEA